MLKSFTDVTIKAADKGEVSAVFSAFNVIDNDGDVTLPGAIKDGTEVVISSYAHGSHAELGGKLPVGKGVIRTTDTEAILEGKFFLNTTHGKDAFETVKQLGALQEWSYHLARVTSERGEWNGQPANIIKHIGHIKEVSPVLIGAGVGTRTLAVKAAGVIPVTGAGVIPAETMAGVDELRKMHAWVNPAGDPASIGSYAFCHHKADGSVDLRACLTGIAWLNGAKGAPTIPESDRQGVYEHLAAHLEDHDHRAPDLKSAGSGMGFTAELGVVLVDVGAALDRAGEVLALRATKGRGLSDEAALLLEWVRDELRKAQSLLDTPTEALAREHLRFLAMKYKTQES